MGFHRAKNALLPTPGNTKSITIGTFLICVAKIIRKITKSRIFKAQYVLPLELSGQNKQRSQNFLKRISYRGGRVCKFYIKMARGQNATPRAQTGWCTPKPGYCSLLFHQCYIRHLSVPKNGNPPFNPF